MHYLKNSKEKLQLQKRFLFEEYPLTGSWCSNSVFYYSKLIKDEMRYLSILSNNLLEENLKITQFLFRLNNVAKFWLQLKRKHIEYASKLRRLTMLKRYSRIFKLATEIKDSFGLFRD